MCDAFWRRINGANPIAFARPRKCGPPMFFDLSVNKITRGTISMALQNGEAISEGWAVARNGNPTTDAQAAREGTKDPTS